MTGPRQIRAKRQLSPIERAAFRPLLERIEERVLPGDTLGLAVLAPLALFQDPLTSIVSPNTPANVQSVSDSSVQTASQESSTSLPALELSNLNQEVGTSPIVRHTAAAADSLFAGGLQSSQSAIAPLSLTNLLGAVQTANKHSRPHVGGTSGLYAAGSASVAASAHRPGSAVHGRDQTFWNTYAHDAQHSGISSVASQSMQAIHWQIKVDMSTSLIHYGSPLITPGNTVVIPTQVTSSTGYKVVAVDGADGTSKWSQPSDWIKPTTPTATFSPAITPSGRLFFAGAGGTLYFRDDLDTPGDVTPGQLAFYGIENYDPAVYNSKVFIETPITSDSQGNIYFGFLVTGTTPLGLKSGLARIDANGQGTWIAASDAAQDPNIVKVNRNCAPALSLDESTLYIGVQNGSSAGYLLALDSTTLQPLTKVALKDPHLGSNGNLSNGSTASPTVGPDGDVYYGVLENPIPSNHNRGWMLHFSSDLSQIKTPGAFGWDNTPTIVPSSMVPSYTGTSDYLLMSKYNNYGGAGGDGVNKIAILDPNDQMVDPITGTIIMNEVLTHAGVTPDPDFPQLPNAVREWCINNAVVDPATNSVIANCEDGKVYRWDLTTPSDFTEVVTLNNAVGEGYTPTLIGADGTVYAINKGTLYAIGANQRSAT